MEPILCVKADLTCEQSFNADDATHSPAAQPEDNAPEDGEGDLRDEGEELDQRVGRQVEEDGHGLEVHALLLQQGEVIRRQSDFTRQARFLRETKRKGEFKFRSILQYFCGKHGCLLQKNRKLHRDAGYKFYYRPQTKFAKVMF